MTQISRRGSLALLPTLVLAAALAGCGTARTVVVEPAKATARYRTLTIAADPSTVAVPADVSRDFEASLRKDLYGSGKFAQGDELRLVYAFVSHNPGNQFQRWFSGGIGNWGEGSLVVHVRYLDKAGQEVAKTQVEGRIGSGFFGGSMSEALYRVSQDVVTFTVTTFAAK